MKKRVIIFIGIIIVLTALFAAYRSNLVPAFAGRRLVSVNVAGISRGEISSKVTASGVVEEALSKEVYVDGTLKLKKLLVDEYDIVTKGQKLFELDLESTEFELEQLKSNRAVQTMNIEKLSATDTKRDTKSLELSLAASENSVKNARIAYDQSVKALMDAASVSGSDTSRLESNVESAKISLDNAEINLSSAVNNLEEARKSNVRSEENKIIDLKIQQENLRILDLRIKDAEDKIVKLEESQYSLMDGIISNIYVNEGLFTSSARSVLKIIDTARMQVKVQINEYSIKDVKEGQGAVITGDAIPKDYVMTGTIDSIPPYAVNSVSSGGQEAVVEAVISVDNQDGILKPGYTVTCDIVTNTKENILIAPMEIISEESDGTLFAYVVNTDDNTLKKHYLKVGIFSDMFIEVIDGLKEEDLCVLDPQPFYSEGMRVNVTQTR